MKASFPRGGDRGKKRERARCSIVRRSVYTEKCTHALFARADTPPFPPFPEVHGGRKRPRERREKESAERVPGGRGGIAGENGCARLRWRSEGRWEEGKDRGEVVTPGWPVYVSGIRRASFLSSFLSPLARSPTPSRRQWRRWRWRGSCFTLFDFFKIYPYRFLAKSLSGRNLRSGNNIGGASPGELHTRFAM